MSAATSAATTTARPAGLYRRMFAVEVMDELRGIWREPTALFFSVLMPVGFFAPFVSLFGNQSVGWPATSSRTHRWPSWSPPCARSTPASA